MVNPNATHTTNPGPPETPQAKPRDPMQDMMGCLIPALLAALPAFLDAFFQCLREENGGSSGYNPGDRKRCT